MTTVPLIQGYNGKMYAIIEVVPQNSGQPPANRVQTYPSYPSAPRRMAPRNISRLPIHYPARRPRGCVDEGCSVLERCCFQMVDPCCKMAEFCCEPDASPMGKCCAKVMLFSLYALFIPGCALLVAGFGTKNVKYEIMAGVFLGISLLTALFRSIAYCCEK